MTLTIKKQKEFKIRFHRNLPTLFKDCDIIATPTVPASAFKIGENIGDPIKMYYNDVCTVTVNIAGLPAISLPCGKDSAGMPMGLQLIGDKFSEQTLLNTAYTYEKKSAADLTFCQKHFKEENNEGLRNSCRS